MQQQPMELLASLSGAVVGAVDAEVVVDSIDSFEELLVAAAAESITVHGNFGHLILWRMASLRWFLPGRAAVLSCASGMLFLFPILLALALSATFLNDP